MNNPKDFHLEPLPLPTVYSDFYVPAHIAHPALLDQSGQFARDLGEQIEAQILGPPERLEAANKRMDQWNEWAARQEVEERE